METPFLLLPLFKLRSRPHLLSPARFHGDWLRPAPSRPPGLSPPEGARSPDKRRRHSGERDTARWRLRIAAPCQARPGAYYSHYYYYFIFTRDPLICPLPPQRCTAAGKRSPPPQAGDSPPLGGVFVPLTRGRALAGTGLSPLAGRREEERLDPGCPVEVRRRDGVKAGAREHRRRGRGQQEEAAAEASRHRFSTLPSSPPPLPGLCPPRQHGGGGGACLGAIVLLFLSLECQLCGSGPGADY